MTQSPDTKTGLLGVLIGALIVVAVGGGILYAMGTFEPTPTNVTLQQPAAPAVTDSDKVNDRDGRRGDWRDRRGDRADWRDRDKDRDRDRDGNSRRDGDRRDGDRDNGRR